MKPNCKKVSCKTLQALLFILFFTSPHISFSQEKILQQNNRTTPSVGGNNSASNISTENQTDLFGIRGKYIQNVGQYGDTLANYGRMGRILYGYEGIGMPVLFTAKGIMYLQRKANPPSYRARKRMQRNGMEEEEIEKAKITIDRTIIMEWVNANPHPQIITRDIAPGYSVYGLLKEKANGYKKIIYKDIYPGIDVEYSFLQSDKAGFEYSLHVKPGADISAVKMKYAGDVKSVETDKEGNLIVRSDIDGITQSVPVCFFTDTPNQGDKFIGNYLIKDNTISFKLPQNYSKERAYIIDPFVTGLTTLTGGSNGKAKDIDFDYDGNIYVTGGGDGVSHKLAKFDAAGSLLWTFNGSLTIPVWSFGGSYGGWVVEKTSGNIYLGQGLAGAGFSVIRLNSAGLYDNYITTPNNNFGENWKMLWSCNGGLPEMLIAGGGGSANNELAVLAPPSTVPATSNLSGLTGGHNDISDIVIDPVTNAMYTIFSKSVNAGGLNNVIFKHPPPYTSASISWQVPTGYTSLREPFNRPYLPGLDNSSNTLAVNSNYLFYWDGVNLKAINKLTGATAGTPFTFPSGILLQQGGIYADECNNVFVGSSNGTIKVYKFDGATFDDAAALDITIAGFPTRPVYDLAYDNAKELLYACGDGFVASFDISTYCPSTLYAVFVVPDCVNLSATATVSPAPPGGTTITYVLFDGSMQIASNATGLFTGLTTGVNYTIKAFLNRACGGTQAVTNFVITTPPVLVITNPGPLCVPGSVDLTTALVTLGSSAGLTYSYWTDATATIPHLSPAVTTAPGIYYIKGTALSGCSNVAPVTVTAFPVPVADAGADQKICFGNNTQLQGTGGVIYSWSPATYLDDPGIPNPRVIRPAAGILIYHLSVTDVNGCKSQSGDDVKIIVTRLAKVFAGNDTAIAFNQPLQLNAIDINNSGFITYTWSPTYGLSNPGIFNPVANLDRDIYYSVKASTDNGCDAFAYIRVKVYKGPEIYVPTGFTPNVDGKNDILKAIVVGMKEFHYFSIYNRWGQLVFTTTDHRYGWDGKIQGEGQASGTFVWMAEGIDYNGNKIQRKGTTTLIR